MSYRADQLVIDARTDGRTDTKTGAGNDNTRRPKLASGKNDKLPVYATNIIFFQLFLVFMPMILVLDEPHSQTAGGELCIHHFLPKTINNFYSELIGMVVSHSYQSFVSIVKKKMISRYVNNCSTQLLHL